LTFDLDHHWSLIAIGHCGEMANRVGKRSTPVRPEIDSMRKLLQVFALSVLLFPVMTVAQVPTPTVAPDPDTVEGLRILLDRAQRRLDDWAQLGRYRDANALVPPPEKGEDRVVFYGDSITDSWKLMEYFPERPYLNRGISGQTTPQMLLRLRSDVIALSPRALVILAGTNDLAGNTGPMTLEMIQHNYMSIAELARAHGIKVIFSSVLPIHDYGPRKISEKRPSDQILKLNEWLRTYCRTAGHHYLDYHTRMIDETGMLRAELANDGLHPNAEGYKIMAPLAEAAIQNVLRKR
jgi:lysophospholipase L1-like esterase